MHSFFGPNFHLQIWGGIIVSFVFGCGLRNTPNQQLGTESLPKNPEGQRLLVESGELGIRACFYPFNTQEAGKCAGKFHLINNPGETFGFTSATCGHTGLTESPEEGLSTRITCQGGGDADDASSGTACFGESLGGAIEFTQVAGTKGGFWIGERNNKSAVAQIIAGTFPCETILQDAAEKATKNPLNEGNKTILYSEELRLMACFDPLSAAEGKCAGAFFNASNEVATFSGGTCTFSGLTISERQSGNVSLSCRLAAGGGEAQSCFGELAGDVAFAKGSNSEPGHWVASGDANSAYAKVISSPSSCSQLIKLELEGGNSRGSSGGGSQDECPSSSNVTALTGSLASVDQCLAASDDESRLKCFLRSLALEVYPSGTNIVEAAMGLLTPASCYVRESSDSDRGIYIFQDPGGKIAFTTAEMSFQINATGSFGVQLTKQNAWEISEPDERLRTLATNQSAYGALSLRSSSETLERDPDTGENTVTYSTSTGPVVRWAPLNHCARKYLKLPYPSGSVASVPNQGSQGRNCR